MKALINGKKSRVAAVLVAGATLLLGVTAGTANAAVPPSTWDVSGTAADVVGVHGWGTIDTSIGANVLLVEANVKDTLSDSHGARVYVRVTAPDRSYARQESVSTSGVDTTNTTEWSFSWQPPLSGEQTGSVSVKECLTEQGADYKCGSWVTVYIGR
jgi:hypothetical protein